MSQNVAAQKTAQSQRAGLLDSLRAVIEAVEPESFIALDELLACHDRLKTGFDRDFERIASLSDLLFSENIENYGSRVTDIFKDWDAGGGGPSLPAIAALAIEKFGLDQSLPIVRAIMLAAVLGEYPNDLQYHGNEHYRKVLSHALRIVATHNAMNVGTGSVLNKDRLAVLLIGACIHDLGHEGGDNARDGVYTPGYMEQKAIDIARPYFEALGLGREEMGEIETIVFCTDITFFAGDNSPCVRMKKIYKHYFWSDESEDVSMMMMGKLRRYEDNPKLALMAMILHEADVATSAGLSYEQTIKETIDIMEERSITTAGPKTVLAFLREQLGETMFTEASKRLFGDVMSQVIHRAESEIQQGRKTFYE